MADENAALQALGLASPVQLYAKIHGVTDAEARVQLEQIRADLAEFGGGNGDQ